MMTEELSSKPPSYTKTQSSKPLPADIQEKHTYASINRDVPTNTDTHFYHGVYNNLGNDNCFDPDEFQENFSIKIIKMNDEELIFDMIGVEAPIANAFRRILIAEVPTMAIETVYIQQNTSIIQDEVLAHRLGLIPIKADPEKFDWVQPGDEPTDKNTIEFTLQVKCTRKKDAKETYPEQLKYENSRVYSSHLKWVPYGSQEQEFQDDPIRPVDDDILIARLRPGQEIEARMRCTKGTGKDHAKFSPVATATYRLLPEIRVHNVTGQKAKELVKKCPVNVFDIEDIEGVPTAFAARPRTCTMCRECIREPGWEKHVQLLRKKNHFIFHVESTKILPPRVLFERAVEVLLGKIEKLREEIVKQTGANSEH